MTANGDALDALSAGHRARLMRHAREVTFPPGHRVCEETAPADRFWVIRSGAVALDLLVPGARAPVFETVGRGEMLGWSWLVEPYRWHFGAQTLGTVEAYAFDAASVRALCRADPEFGFSMMRLVTGTMAGRLDAARTRLLALYGTCPRTAVITAHRDATRAETRIAVPMGLPAEQGPSRVAEVMTRSVVAVDALAPFKRIADTLQRWRISALPVLDGIGRVIGVVSEADLLRKEESHDRRPALLDGSGRPQDSLTAGAVTAEELMTTPAVTVRGDAAIAEAARIMARSQVKRLPVVDPDGRLSGIVSRTDLLKVFLRADEEIAADVRRELSGAPFLAGEPPEVRVEEGVVTVGGSIADTSYIPLAVRLVRTVEGVVDVEPRLTGPGPVPEPGQGESRAGPRGGTVSR